MGRPYALLRIGFSYDRSLGMRRLTNTPASLTVDSGGDLHILCRGEGVTFVRRLTIEDEDKGAYNLVGGGGQVGGTFSVNGTFMWPSFITKDADENLWLPDEGTNQISVLNREGEVLNQWGEPVVWFVLAPLTEEPWLRDRFGVKYDLYMNRVPRFLSFRGQDDTG